MERQTRQHNTNIMTSRYPVIEYLCVGGWKLCT